jgi:hypothetical protein
VFGEGAFLVDVQAHGLFVEPRMAPTSSTRHLAPDSLYKREGGQLLLLKIPAA